MPDPNDPTDPTALRAFWHGLTRPSPGALALSAVMVIAIASFGLRTMTPEMMASPIGAYWVENAADDYAYLSRAVEQIRLAPPAPISVSILGASAIEEALTSTDVVRDVIENKTRLRPAVYNLTAANLSIVEMGALLDRIADGLNGVVVLGVGLRAFSYEPKRFDLLMKHPRLAFVSPVLDHEAFKEHVTLPWRSGNFLIDNRQFFALRFPYFLKNLWKGAPERRQHGFMLPGQIQGREREKQLERFNDYLRVWQRRFDENVARFSRIIERIERRADITIAVVEPPANWAFVAASASDAPYDEHRAAVRAFVNGHGWPYWYLTDEAGLSADDFYDWAHLRKAQAQDRFTRVMAERIAPLLEQHVRERQARRSGSRASGRGKT